MRIRRSGLQLIRELVLSGAYHWSKKVQEQIEDGWFSRDDLVECVLTGFVHKTERDEFKDSMGNKKYVIIGRDTYGNPFYTAGKIKRARDGKYYFFITGHEAR
jgi:hypothetical protein